MVAALFLVWSCDLYLGQVKVHELMVGALSLVWSCDPVSRSGEGSWTDGGIEKDLNPQRPEEATEPCPEAAEDTDHPAVQARTRTGQSTHDSLATFQM